jgi:hypothetical protein
MHPSASDAVNAQLHFCPESSSIVKCPLVKQRFISSVSEPHYFYSAPVPGKNFDPAVRCGSGFVLLLILYNVNCFRYKWKSRGHQCSVPSLTVD